MHQRSSLRRAINEEKAQAVAATGQKTEIIFIKPSEEDQGNLETKNEHQDASISEIVPGAKLKPDLDGSSLYKKKHSRENVKQQVQLGSRRESRSSSKSEQSSADASTSSKQYFDSPTPRGSSDGKESKPGAKDESRKERWEVTAQRSSQILKPHVVYDTRFGSNNEEEQRQEGTVYGRIENANFVNFSDDVLEREEGLRGDQDGRVVVDGKGKEESRATSASSRANQTSETVSEQLDVRRNARATSRDKKVVMRREGPISPILDKEDLPAADAVAKVEEKVGQRGKKVPRWALTPSKEDIDDFWGSRTFLVKSFFKKADVSSSSTVQFMFSFYINFIIHY